MRRGTLPLMLFALTSSVAGAADLIDTAQVISATPNIDRVTETREECANVERPVQERSVAAPIIGGVAGAILGNQVGRGNGRTAATAAGAIAGAIVGDSVGNARARGDAYGPGRCRTVESSHDVVKGYTVVYRYNGRDITTTLPYQPGSTVQVGVSVLHGTPAAAAYPPGAVPPSGGVAPNPPLVPASNLYR